jgi:hypothetical protein
MVAGGGGAGGGAILIASSVSIDVLNSGRIDAFGGGGGPAIDDPGNTSCDRGNFGGGGGASGGAIRLVAPTVKGSGALNVSGGGSQCTGFSSVYGGGGGRTRVEAFQHQWTFGGSGVGSSGSPLNSFVPPSGAAVAVSSITTTVNGQSVPVFVPEKPTGSFAIPDAVINSSSPATFEIRARGVPVGTNVDLYIFSLEAADQAIRSTVPLASIDDPTGRFTTSTTVQVTLPSGMSRGYVRAKW